MQAMVARDTHLQHKYTVFVDSCNSFESLPKSGVCEVADIPCTLHDLHGTGVVSTKSPSHTAAVVTSVGLPAGPCFCRDIIILVIQDVHSIHYLYSVMRKQELLRFQSCCVMRGPN